jgi:ubiquinol-cytochrome c reductase cytochrome c subunit
MTTLKKKKQARRSSLASVALVVFGLLITGGVYAVFNSASADADTTAYSAAQIEEGKNLFVANCATCHGLDLAGTYAGPSLIGVGAASVHFQVGTGRMPMANSAPQAPVKPVVFTEEQILSLAAYVASISPGPAIPSDKYLDANGNAANGGELFRINCAMCHNVAGAGGALTGGKFAPALDGVAPVHIYEAMITGPQNMPVFNDMNVTPEDKRDIITYLKYMESNAGPGGFTLGSLGPVSEGLFVWIFGLGGILGIVVWMTSRAN